VIGCSARRATRGPVTSSKADFEQGKIRRIRDFRYVPI